MCTRIRRSSDGSRHQLDVALDVAHGRVHLGQRDAQLGHVASLSPGKSSPEAADDLRKLTMPVHATTDRDLLDQPAVEEHHDLFVNQLRLTRYLLGLATTLPL
jgi:hypothetical protein